METNTAKHAQRELEILVKSSEQDNRPIIEPFITEILSLCEKFGLSGQSGGSAPYTATAIAQAIKKLLLQEPICPITGIDEEWMDVANVGDGSILFQNKRCSALFKDAKGCWYLDAIVWKTQTGQTWSGAAYIPYAKHRPDGKVLSRQYIKGFPFTPKTFYIDVIEKEISKGDWEFYIKDEKQLKKVFKYYDDKR